MKLKFFLVTQVSAVLLEELRASRQPSFGRRSFGDYEGVEELVKEPTMSTCELRSSDGESQNCCNGVNLECYGCNPLLHGQGIACADQTKDISAPVKRDCFCDSSCILFDDCCGDHPTLCAHLYDSNDKVTTKGPDKDNVTPTKVETTKKSTTKSTTTTTRTTTEDVTTTKFPAVTTTPKKSTSVSTNLPDLTNENGASWVFLQLFRTFSKLIDEKWEDKRRHSMMIHKMNHIYTYMHNAEFNCRLEKYPFLGMPDDGKFHDFDDIWKGVQKEKKSGNDYKTRMDFLNLGFQRYIEDFYFKSETSEEVQGCDGKNQPGKKNGKQFRLKRLGRKIRKSIKKIVRRKRIAEKRKNQQVLKKFKLPKNDSKNNSKKSG